MTLVLNLNEVKIKKATMMIYDSSKLSKSDNEKINLCIKMIKRQMGRGIEKPDFGDIINKAIEFIDNIGIPLTKTMWNKVIFPLLDTLILSKLSDSERDSVKNILQAGEGKGIKIRNNHVVRNPKLEKRLLARKNINFSKYMNKNKNVLSKHKNSKCRVFHPSGSGLAKFTNGRSKFKPIGQVAQSTGNRNKFAPKNGKRVSTGNKWVNHVKRYMKLHGISYRDALSAAKPSYRAR